LPGSRHRAEGYEKRRHRVTEGCEGWRQRLAIIRARTQAGRLYRPASRPLRLGSHPSPEVESPLDRGRLRKQPRSAAVTPPTSKRAQICTASVFSLYVQDHRCCGLPTLAKPCSLQRARPGAGGPRGKILRHRRVLAPVENGAWHRTARPDEDRRRGTQTADAAASRSRS